MLQECEETGWCRLIGKRAKRAIIASWERDVSRGPPRFLAAQRTLVRNDNLRLSGGQRLHIALARDGQAQYKHRSALRLVLAGDLSAMVLHYAIHGAQS